MSRHAYLNAEYYFIIFAHVNKQKFTDRLNRIEYMHCKDAF